MNGFWDIFKKVHFVTILSIFGSVLPKFDFFLKNTILNVLWYSIFMRKIIKNGWTVQKIFEFEKLNELIGWGAFDICKAE